jgi:hypothetical protein
MIVKRQMILFLTVLIIIWMNCSGNEKQETVNPQVQKLVIPELQEMHEVIYPMWHKAYPQKDTELLKALYPQLIEHYHQIEKVEIPKEYQDRQHQWSRMLAKMNTSLNDYEQAMSENNKEALLSAARQVHDAYEGLAKVVNPPLPEIDEFHKVLYNVYHIYLPEDRWDDIKASIPKFESTLADINQVELPQWMSDKKDAFDKARQDLTIAVENLAKLKDSNDHSSIKDAVLKVHDAYEKLENVME